MAGLAEALAGYAGSALAGSGRHGRLWQGVAGCVWQALAGRQALAAAGSAISGRLWQALAGSGRGVTAFFRVPPRNMSRPPSKASPGFQEPPGLPSLLRAFWVQGVFLPEVLISASCAEHPSIFSSTFSIFEAFCVARPHASWPDPAPISIPHGTFSAIFEDHDDPCPAHATAVPTPHIANGGEKLISTATEPVFAYPIKVARNSPTKPSAFHYASWFGHSVFSGPVVSSGNFVCSEGFGRNMKI